VPFKVTNLQEVTVAEVPFKVTNLQEVAATSGGTVQGYQWTDIA
jgi:hypothetical protein